MAVSDRVDRSGPSGSPARSEPRGFRPTSRRRARIALGAAMAAVAIGGNVLLYTALGETTEVLQIVRNVRAGEVITSDDLRVVDVDVDPSVPIVTPQQIGLVVNQYARVYITSGSLVAPQLVQPTPLVSAGASVVALEIRATRVPSELRERSRVMIVVVPKASDDEPFVTTGRVVGRGTAESITGVFGLSVEVPESDAAIVAAADDVRVAVLDPGADPAIEGGG